MNTILVAIDEDPLIEKIIQTAGKIASKLGATITLCQVMEEEIYRKIEEQQKIDRVEPPFSISQAEDQAKNLAEEAGKCLRHVDVHFKP